MPPLLWDIGITPASQTTIYESSRSIICCGLARNRRCHLHSAKRLFSEHGQLQSRSSSRQHLHCDVAGCFVRRRNSRPRRATRETLMQGDYAQQYGDLQQWHWWFRGRRRVIESILRHEVDSVSSLDILSVGCGPAEELKWLVPFAGPKQFSHASDGRTPDAARVSGPSIREIRYGDCTPEQSV